MAKVIKTKTAALDGSMEIRTDQGYVGVASVEQVSGRKFKINLVDDSWLEADAQKQWDTRKLAKAKSTKPKRTIPTSPNGKCLCGCGENVTREFKPGHDARYKGALIQEVLAGGNQEAENTLKARGWLPFLEKSRVAQANKAERKAGAKTKRERVQSTVSFSVMKEAAAALKRVGRYGVSSGERQIELAKDEATLKSIIDGTHPDYTDKDRKVLAG